MLVLQSNSPPTLAPVDDRALYALMTLIVTNLATDPDADQVLTFSLDPGAPSGASINPTNGLLVWTPSIAQLGSNSLTVRVTDNGLPNLSDAKSFAVTVLAGPVLENLSLLTNGVTLSWNAISGDTYRVQYQSNLADRAWLDLVPDVLATNSSASFTDTNLNPVTFYRIEVIRSD